MIPSQRGTSPTRDHARSIRTAFATLLGVLVLGLAGCGDSASEPTGSESAGGGPAGRAGTETGPGAGAPAQSQDTRPGADAEQRAGGNNGEDGNGRDEPFADVPAADREHFADAAAANTLKALGFPGSEVEVAAGGSAVTVTIKRSYACAAEPGKVDEIVAEVREIIPYAKRIRLLVALEGGPLAQYVRTECARLEAPTASGPILASVKAVGARASDEFEVRARKFTVTWANRAGDLELHVAEGKKTLKPPIRVSGARTGRRVYRGSGKYRLIGYGGSRWEARAYASP